MRAVYDGVSQGVYTVDLRKGNAEYVLGGANSKSLRVQYSAVRRSSMYKAPAESS